ncbi:MAG TPA: DUF72 domain-containing protein [Thermoanaerobaculia bacterium]|nr:DUF72 domain-containing protein [Thermoanaerobaculia bacterium]
MELIVGTSGYSYKEWKGNFYPEDLAASKMLSWYAGRFRGVEINNSFYRMPVVKTVEQWGSQVGDAFRFAIKAPQRITHQKRLVDTADDVRYLFETAAVLGEKLGPVLFQLPPFFRKDTGRLRDFLAAVPQEPEVAFEFRHASWFDEEVYDVLRDFNVALCGADTDDAPLADQQTVATSDWGYLRLRRLEYTAGDLQRWGKRIEEMNWKRAYVFFKHEDEGKGPQFAAEFERQLREAASSF